MELSRRQVERYFEDGFLIVENLFSRDELQAAMDDIAEIVEELARHLYAAGRIGELYDDRDFQTRLAAIEKESPGAALWVTHRGDLKPGLRRLWAHDKLLNIVARIIGPDIAGHPIWNNRSKTPRTALMTVPWHQDTAYLLPGAEKTEQPAGWIALTDVTTEKGALQVVRGGHKSGRLLRHHIHRRIADAHSSFLYIEEEELPAGEVVTCEMPIGSVALLNQLVPHRSLENHSDEVRWSLDFRWQRPDQPSGQEGILDPIVMRRGDDPQFRPDWADWLAAYRKVHDGYRGKSTRDEFDAAYDGYWLKRWE